MDNMPSGGYFLNLTGAVLLGIATLIVAAVLVLALSPYILPFFVGLLPFLVGAVLLVAAIIIIWLVIYIAATIGVAIYYIIKHPMKVSDKPGTYGLDKVKESGRREKGDSSGKSEEKKEEK
jgi:hypothetical protein